MSHSDGEVGGIVGEFFALKDETDADYLVMQVGDFYEFFGDDAEAVSDLLDLKVSQKSSHGSNYPMAGVPVDKLTPHLKQLVERGYRVAIADQHETADGHAREITRVVTPGTLLETTRADAQYLAGVVRTDDARYGLAFADVTTGRFLVTEVEGPDPEAAADRAFTELYRFDPAEVLPGPEVRNDDAFVERIRERTDATLTLHRADAFAPGRATHATKEQFGEETLASIGLDGGSRGAGGGSPSGGDRPQIRAAGALLSYVEETGTGVKSSMTRLQNYEGDDHVSLDATTQRNLELTETMQGDRDGSLFATIDHTATSPGKRLLKEWVQRPRRDLPTLRRRADGVAAFANSALARETVRETLDGAYDLERLASKAAHGSADARDLLRVRETLDLLPAVADAIESDPRLADSPLAEVAARPDREAAAALREELAAIVEDPPGTVTEGGLFERGHDDQLDDLIDRHEEAEEWIATLDDREKRETGITHLQVDRNKTDGYYIQVGNSETGKVPDRYDRLKSLKNSERYTTDELNERERRIFRLEERRGELEYELFRDLRERVAARADLLQSVGRALAELDALASLALHAVENDWVRPELRESGDLDIEEGRHPVVEQTTQFVPNDLRMDEARQFLVVTGPNMSGKSTYMRQVALITLLAQIGSFVPAASAEIGVVDGIYTRVGALDELAQGRSTFMVEMQELSNILHSATDESLVILDEVGRGTATYDGISIAWAATEYLHNEVRSKTLFATHYHELTTLADHLDRVENVHVAADESDGDVTFLRTVEDGPTDRSYGIHVADLAGVPAPVVERSRGVLDKLRQDKAIEAKGGGGDSGGTKQVVFDVGSGELKTDEGASGTGNEGEKVNESASETDAATDDSDATDAVREEFGDDAEAVLAELAALEVSDTAPIELLNRAQEWQERLDE
ncbi:DNA mismatch repair protein MutS [Halorussus gelatinilyticus]|uniref:DNA mismatch repair protein MutS n=1 Tax=Halorussus gelatinilyticus TaxID=2937524 RepID=A0A8U0IN44_9EURY|nr:DNA mismatch repair protein MutS [Halorussus gelatinilyticus]UPW02168.1 DNA mismatch repair protein MutS [Halorussus gelatinilyticus]